MQTAFRLLGIFYKNTLINELEYRLNFVANIALSLFWLVWAALSVRVYFFHADSIAGAFSSLCDSCESETAHTAAPSTPVCGSPSYVRSKLKSWISSKTA